MLALQNAPMAFCNTRMLHLALKCVEHQKIKLVKLRFSEVSLCKVALTIVCLRETSWGKSGGFRILNSFLLLNDGPGTVTALSHLDKFNLQYICSFFTARNANRFSADELSDNWSE